MANIGRAVTKDRADEGVWFPLELYGETFPVSIKLYGTDSDIVIQHAKDRLRNLRNRKNKDSENDFEELIESTEEDVLIRIAEIKSDDDDPKIWLDEKTEIENNIYGYKLLLEKIPAIKDFILRKSNERKNFLS